MKVRKNYVLYVNSMLGTATYGNEDFGDWINAATIGSTYDCTFNQLKWNLHYLRSQGFRILKSRRS